MSRKKPEKFTGVQYKCTPAWYLYVICSVLFVTALVCVWMFFLSGNMGIMAVGLWLLVALVAVFLPRLWLTRYELHDEALFLQDGLFDKKQLLYRNILDLGDQKTGPADGNVKMGTGKSSVFLRYKLGDKSYWMGLSPTDREGFLAALEEKRLSH